MANLLDDESVRVLRQVVRQVLSEYTDRYDRLEYLQLRQTHIKEGVLDGALAKGGSATLSEYTGEGGNWADTGENITVKFPTGKGSAIGSGKWVVVAWLNGEWRPIASEC